MCVLRTLVLGADIACSQGTRIRHRQMDADCQAVDHLRETEPRAEGKDRQNSQGARRLAHARQMNVCLALRTLVTRSVSSVMESMMRWRCAKLTWAFLSTLPLISPKSALLVCAALPDFATLIARAADIILTGSVPLCLLVHNFYWFAQRNRCACCRMVSQKAGEHTATRSKCAAVAHPQVSQLCLWTVHQNGCFVELWQRRVHARRLGNCTFSAEPQLITGLSAELAAVPADASAARAHAGASASRCRVLIHCGALLRIFCTTLARSLFLGAQRACSHCTSRVSPVPKR